MNKIYLLRHGENLSNKKRIFSCGKINFELTNFGISQAIKQAYFFKDKTISIVFSSPAIRAKQTAEIISDNKFNIELTDLLLEVNVGDLEGKSELDKNYWDQYQNVIKSWENGSYSNCFPNGESLNDVHFRLNKFEIEQFNYSYKNSNHQFRLDAKHGA